MGDLSPIFCALVLAHFFFSGFLSRLKMFCFISQAHGARLWFKGVIFDIVSLRVNTFVTLSSKDLFNP